MTRFKGTSLKGITKGKIRQILVSVENPINNSEEQVEALGSDNPTLPIVFQIVDWNKIRYFARRKKLIIGLDKFAIRKDQRQLKTNIEISPK